MNNLIKIEVYTNDYKKPVLPEGATVRYVTEFKIDKVGIRKTYQEYSSVGWDVKSDSPIVRYYDSKEFKEEEHPRDEGGQFTSGGNVADYKERKTKEIKPRKEEREKLIKVDETVSRNIEEVIQIMGYQDKIAYVEMQGSYAKGTDLTGNSDLDLFVIFNKNVPRDEFEKIGLEIGKKALKDYKPYTRYAEHPFTEAFVGDVEIQIVPAYDISLEDIKNQKLLSATDRTPHQTRFMNEALSDEQKTDVRLLKNFMKESRTYGSDQKIQGFSGYSAEVLIHELGSFENTLNFFADFEKGKQLGTSTQKHTTAFAIADPIDPHRNLVSAFSDQKIARMIKTSREFLKTGEIPKPTTQKVDSIGITFGYDERSDDKLYGEINKSINAISTHLSAMGYDTKKENEKITDDYNVSIPRVSYDVDKEKHEVKIYLGLDKFENNLPVRVRGPPVENEKAVKAFKDANPDSKIQMEVIDGEKRLVRYEERKNIDVQSAIDELLTMKLEKTGISKGIIDDIKNNGFSIEDKKEREFENLV